MGNTDLVVLPAADVAPDTPASVCCHPDNTCPSVLWPAIRNAVDPAPNIFESGQWPPILKTPTPAPRPYVPEDTRPTGALRQAWEATATDTYMWGFATGFLLGAASLAAILAHLAT
ncbi:hypothetical protein [Stackebrandtia nassauensis]|uniref:Uncharacterized protein n=1 Tax=Stackebrandtia nassauensis (strain DSM 44728 / CIP 108903 / NRRL B-16338 / NBRC 102104 / LLR-40K-21) TaxID=446470 RepID=D3Q2G6_STANL|nr:hypothetical protein [Stackebrandtia nassauensis]ADD43899.1 hypothetical protein Snas_4250 [Stackebrandtia nassauensis DSM 44728]